jgi:hypothetical protein
MTIPTQEETKDLYDNTHILEVCVFCLKKTKFWHMRTNNPVCQICAKKHKVSELINWRR